MNVKYSLFAVIFLVHGICAMDVIQKPQQPKKNRRPDYVYDKFSGEDIQTYCAARSLANSIVAAVSCQKLEKNNKILQSFQESLMNVDGCDTTCRAGLQLGFVDGVPCKIFTKWGKWQFIDNAYATHEQKSFLIAATLRLISIEKFKTVPYEGECVISLNAVGNKKITENESAQLMPKEKIDQWRTLTAWYNTPKKPTDKKNGTLDIIGNPKMRARL